METRAVREDAGRRRRLADQRREDVDHRHARGELHHGASPAPPAKDGDATGITVFLVPADEPGVKIEEYLWTFNMPTDHPRVSFTDVWVPDDAIWGVEGRGLGLGQSFVHQNRIRQAASSLGAAVYCIEESVKYARHRKPFGKPLSDNQAIQWPLVELHTQCEMLRLLIRKTAWEIDRMPHKEVERQISDKVSHVQLLGEPAGAARRPTGPCRCTAASAIRGTSRSSTSIATTAATGSPRARKRSRCARWRAFLFGYAGPRRAMFRQEEAINA